MSEFAVEQPKSSTRMAPRTIVDVVVLTILSTIGIIGFATSFESYGWLVAGLVGLVVGTTIAVASHLLRLGILTTFLFAVVGFFVFGSAAALPQLALFGVVPTIESLTQLTIGTVYGWADLLTLRAPVELPDYVTAVPYFAGWAVALVSTLLAVRWLPRRRRNAWRAAAMLAGPFALYFTGVLFGTEEPFYAALRGITFAALALVWLGWRRGSGAGVNPKEDRAIVRRKVVGSALVVGAAVLVGVFVGTSLAPAPDNRFVLREEVKPPFEPLTYPSPFAAYRKYTKTLEETELFSVSGLETGDRIRLATLDTYDGISWGVAGSAVATDGSGSFSLVGKTIPAAPLVTEGDARTLDLTVLGYSDVWIPSIGYADSITFSGETAHDQAAALRYNPATGTAVVTTGLAEGDEVEVDAVRQQDFSTESLLETPPASMQLPPVSNIPDVVSAKAVELAGPATSPIEQLRAIESTLQTTGFLSHGAADDAVASRAGQGADRMVELFTRTQLIGDEEQYATAFTLMARSLGYPARVVMGFAPEVADGEGEVTVLGADVTAWSEVAFEGVGWVPFYPTPDETDIPQDQNPKPQSEPQPQVRQPPRTDKDDNDLVAGVEVDDSDSDDDTLFELPGWVIAAGASLLVLLLLIFVPLLLAGAIKARRAARRRSAATADASAAGAWDELLDRFSELGYDVPSNLTRRHTAVALGAQATTATSELRTVAARSDEAVFSGVEVDRATSDVVWTEAMAAVRLAAAARTRWNRIVARYRISAVSAWAHRVSTLVSTDSASSRRK